MRPNIQESLNILVPCGCWLCALIIGETSNVQKRFKHIHHINSRN
ncbi:hypothetical protein 109_039 [Pseudomonas phage 109]|uniref:Phage protein n=1 Tax=Pseudomonas phage 109 TaxID=3056216 RepID=A0AAX4B0F5_9CAUD|nr:hypothetical protein 109_039 [Pseudomonas phage 109]WPF70674.1 hypothetical protein [Pseudomonas phage BL2]